MGAVAYDPKVVTIWDGLRRWLRAQGLGFDYVLYSNYERQVEELVAGRIDAAWNSPLAWVRAQRLAKASGVAVRALVMRDTDRDLVSVVVTGSRSPIRSAADLSGATVATGAIDSPQGTLLPLDTLRQQGLAPGDFKVCRFDVGMGLHGDHVGGEREAVRALVAGEVDAACLLDANHLVFAGEGLLAPGATRVIATTPHFDHCNMTVRDDADAALVEQFKTLLLAMDYGDAEVRPLLDLEGLTQWVEGRLDGYGPLERAVEASGFYDASGSITQEGYVP